MRSSIQYIMLLSIIALVLHACKSSDEPSPTIPREAVYDFVTLEESSENGSLLTMRKNADSPLISYFSDVDFSHIQTINDGDRLIICYNRADGETYTSGKITLYGYVLLNNSDQKMLCGYSSDYDGWRCPAMKIKSLWRTGTFINLDADISVFHAGNPETFVIVADQATVDDDYPQLYIYYKNGDDNDGRNPYRVYASFDIAEIWETPSCRGVTINYPTPDGVSSMTIQK